MSKKSPRRRILEARTRTYTHWHILLASATQPMAPAKRRHHLTTMWSGLANIEQGTSPTTHDWRVCSDAVNMMETLVTQGTALDADGLLMDAITTLALAGKRHKAGGQIRLDGPGITAVRAILEDYAAALEQLPERTMITCHRDTETRIRDILAGRKQPHDIEVMEI